MNKIITKIYKLIKETDDLITLEESIKHLMNDTFTELVSDIFTQLNQSIKEKAQKEKLSVVRDDSPHDSLFIWRSDISSNTF